MKIKLNRLLACWLLMIIASSCWAQSLNNSLEYIEYLKQQQANLSLSVSQLAKYAKASDTKKIEVGELKDAIESAKLLNKININRLTRLNQSLESYQQAAKQLNARKKQLMALQVNPLYKQHGSSQKKVDDLDKVNQVNFKTITLLQLNISLSSQYQDLLKTYVERLNLQYDKKDLDDTLRQMTEQQKKLSGQISELIANSIALQKNDKNYSFSDDILLELKLLLNNQKVKRLQLENDLLTIKKRLAAAGVLIHVVKDSQHAHQALLIRQKLGEQLNELHDEISRSIELLGEQNDLVKKSKVKNSENLQQQHHALINQFKQLNKKVNDVSKKNTTALSLLAKTAKQGFNAGQEIFDSSYNKSLLFGLVDVPKQFYKHLGLLAKQVQHQISTVTLANWILFVIFSIILLAVILVIKSAVKKQFVAIHKRVSTQLINTVFYLLNNNLLYLAFVVWGVLFAKTISLPFENYRLVLTMSLVILVFKLILSLIKTTLYERISDISGHDVKLYYQLRACFLFAAVTTCLMLISHKLLLQGQVQQFLNWLFMLFLLALSIILLKSRHLIPGLLRPLIRPKRVYVKRFVLLLSFLIPLSLLINAVTGLMGYIQLAWTMGYYQVIFILWLSLYVIARGLLVDLLELFSEWMIQHLNNGWLWSDVFLKPLHRILRLLLLLSFIITLALSYGWTTNQLILSKLSLFFSFTIVNISGIHITITSTLQFIILLSIFIWAAKWVREFCYRWLFKDIRDAGIRNSFSIFSQYALIIIGTIITFRVLGVEFSGVSYILGGLAVGMGFGLRDFASNIIGGMMLLIERPVREGDLITLGNYEGRVAHIGIRSMRVRSWDNMEVLIPNAETFNKPFTNWTHQDSIVRTVVPIKVQPSEDPLKVQQLIYDVLKIMPDVLEDPAPQVFLKQIDEALVSFEVRYFINLDKIARFESRSNVLFAITAQFKAAGIKPPIPPISITRD